MEDINIIAEQVKAIFVEAEFNAKMTIIEAHHEVGKLLLNLEGNKTELVQSVAVKIGRSERTLWECIKFAKRFNKIEDIPEGKNMSMNKIRIKYLTTPKELADHIHAWITICSVCKERKND